MIFPYNDYYLQYKRSFYLHAGSHVQTDFKQTTCPLVTANVTLRTVTYSWLILPDQNCFHHARNRRLDRLRVGRSCWFHRRLDRKKYNKLRDRYHSSPTYLVFSYDIAPDKLSPCSQVFHGPTNSDLNALVTEIDRIELSQLKKKSKQIELSQTILELCHWMH